MIFQCPACRALVTTSHVTRDEDGTRAGLECSDCGTTSWLPFNGESAAAASADDVSSPEDAEDEIDEERERRALAVVKQALVTPAPSTSVFDDDELAELRDAISEAEIEVDNEEVAKSFDALLERWADKDEHRKLVRRASLLDALPALGVRYRKVLEMLPDDERALQGQKEILALAMAQMQTMADARPAAGETRRAQAWAIAITGAIFIGGLVFLFRMVSRL